MNRQSKEDAMSTSNTAATTLGTVAPTSARRRTRVWVATSLMTLLVVSTLSAQRPRGRNAWVNLGTKVVSDALDRDTIKVSSQRTDFKALRLRVSDRPVQFRRIEIHFRNGQEQVIKGNQVVQAGRMTRIIDLQGRDRKIEKVVMLYDAQSLRGKSARVTVLARR